MQVDAYLIRKFLKEEGINVGRGKYFTSQEIKEIRDKYTEGIGSTQLSKDYNTGEDNIRSLLRKNLIKIRSFKENNNIRNQKEVYRISRVDNTTVKYNSVKEALHSVNIYKNNGQIKLVLDKSGKTYKGFIWRSKVAN